MEVYFIIFLLISFFHFLSKKNKTINDFSYYLIFAILIIFVGLRDDIGGDWDNYFSMYNDYSSQNFWLIIKRPSSDFAYELINYIVYSFNLSFYFVNLICALISFVCLFKFCKRLKDPFIGVLISLPVLIIVVYMGFVRQGCAISLGFLGIYYLLKKKIHKYFLFTALACLFHKTAVVYFFYIAVIVNWNKIRTSIIFFLSKKLNITLFFSFFLFLIYYKQYYISFLSTYISWSKQSNYISLGVIPRLMMNLLPAISLLIIIKKININRIEKKVTLTTIFLIIMSSFFVTIMPTAVDRLNFYLIFIQIFFFEKVKMLFIKKFNQHLIYDLSIIYLYLFILTTWIFFAKHSNLWKYKFFL